MVMFCAESSVVAFLSLLCFRLVILLFYVFIVYLYPCAALCAYSINEWMNRGKLPPSPLWRRHWPYVRVSPDTSSFCPLSGRPGGFSKICGLSGFLAQSASTFERCQLQRRTTASDKESSLVFIVDKGTKQVACCIRERNSPCIQHNFKHLSCRDFYT